MYLDLTRVRSPKERFADIFQAQAFGRGEDAFAVAGPVSLAFDILKDQDRFQLVGRVRTVLELPCSRCLEPFGWPVDVPFDLRYQPRASNEGEGEREIQEDDLSTAYYENDVIDLDQLMREQFYLALPMKPLCDSACRGLCPVCGTNLNHRACLCRRDWDDPRLAPLNAWKSRES